MRRLSALSALFAALLGVVRPDGWALDLDALKGMSGQTNVKANTAVGFIAIAVALYALGSRARGGTRVAGRAAAVLVAALALGTLSQDLLGWDLGIDQAARGVTGVGFTPEYAAVLPASAQRANQRYAGMTRGFQFDNDTGTTTRITSLDADGFSVGNSAEANTNGTVYHYIAFNEAAGSVNKGSYAGTGASKAVTGVGFSPRYAMVRANDTATARRGHQRSAATAGTGSQFFTNLADITTGIPSLNADGFSVGTDASVNANGPTYHYLAFRNAGG